MYINGHSYLCTICRDEFSDRINIAYPLFHFPSFILAFSLSSSFYSCSAHSTSPTPMHTPGLFPLEISIAERPPGNYIVEIRLTDLDGLVAMLTVAYEIEGRGCLFPYSAL